MVHIYNKSKAKGEQFLVTKWKTKNVQSNRSQCKMTYNKDGWIKPTSLPLVRPKQEWKPKWEHVYMYMYPQTCKVYKIITCPPVVNIDTVKLQLHKTIVLKRDYLHMKTDHNFVIVSVQNCRQSFQNYGAIVLKRLSPQF